MSLLVYHKNKLHGSQISEGYLLPQSIGKSYTSHDYIIGTMFKFMVVFLSDVFYNRGYRAFRFRCPLKLDVIYSYYIPQNFIEGMSNRIGITIC